MNQVSIPMDAVEASDCRSVRARATATLKPALFARYGTLARLRYDFPLVLIEGKEAVLRPLSAIIDDILGEIAAPDTGGEALRQQILGLENAIRQLVVGGERDTLSNLWRRCAADLLSKSGEPPFGPLDTNLDRAREVLRVDGLVIDCDANTPKAVFIHAWQRVHTTKAKEFRRMVDGLILGLSDILKAEFMKSDAARTPDALQASIGTSFSSAFDFDALSSILSHGEANEKPLDDRQKRINWALNILRTQRFYEPGRSSESKSGQPQPHGFIFESCAAALDAFRQRLPEIIEFVKALTIAELEIANRYRVALHDAEFEQFNETDLSAEQLALLPYSLVCLRDGRTDTVDTVQAFEALASGLPIKVLIATDDILGNTSPEPSRTAFGVGSARLAAMAVGLNSAYVLQASSAYLSRTVERVVTGMRYDGPALFCVFSGAVETVPHVAPYLLAAAATESRAFPTFTYDPSAGPDWASRFDLNDNPQVTHDWAQHNFDYEDEAMQRKSEDIAFSYVDFTVCDQRYAHYCHSSGCNEWNKHMVPVSQCLAPSIAVSNGQLPYVLTLGADEKLRRTVVDDKIVEAARHCNDAWHQLQELAGINNSHAIRLVAKERQIWKAEALKDIPLPDAGGTTSPAEELPAQAVPASEALKPQETVEEASNVTDEPWIETARCTTCNECTQINNRVFAYDDNMQAYILNPAAGTYREIVEAAESCQVSIIHPGKPGNPQEPNLQELIARAESFN
jgi:hypothetical protein